MLEEAPWNFSAFREFQKEKSLEWVELSMPNSFTKPTNWLRHSFYFDSLFFETGSYGIDGLKLVILLTQPPECWDFRHAPLYLARHSFSQR
jgi:hypothetical protein